MVPVAMPPPPRATPVSATPTVPPTLPSYVVGALPPHSEAVLGQAVIGLEWVTHILPSPIFLDEKRMSGGTHGPSGHDATGATYGNAIDIVPAASIATRRQELRRLRLAGFAAWSRGASEPGGAAGNGDHYHLVWAGAKTTNRDQRQQLCSFLGGYRGIASGKSKRLWQRDPTIQKDEIDAVRRLWRQTSGRRVVDACSPYEAMHRPYR